MQTLSFRYTGWVNWRSYRTDHLFQGRYKAVLVDGDCSLLELGRFIFGNPDGYPWTSHPASLGRDGLPWLSTEDLLGQFGRQVRKAHQKDIHFIQDGFDEEYYQEFHCNGCGPSIPDSDDMQQQSS